VIVSLLLALLCLDLKMKFKRALAFRVNFVLRSAIALFYSFIFSIFQFFVYSRVHGYPGWSPEQMLLFQATLILWTGTVDFLFGGIKELIDVEVAYGNFDRYFLWPPHTLVSLLSRGTNIYASGTLLAGVVGVLVMLVRLEVRPDPVTLLLFTAFFCAGVAFYAALLILYSGFTLFMVKMERLREVLDRIVFFGSFPTDAYFGPGKTAFLVLFPMALWVYLPVQALLGRLPVAGLGSLAAAAGFVFVALRVWRRQELEYVSAGG
jgi:ABC-type uncharacterized transport system permease subunit